VFDPAAVVDRATYADPIQYATGMRWAIVNGRIALSEGEATGTLAGLVLRK
jgi:N-acyl-D-aspartate/D-glutamate deacylase